MSQLSWMITITDRKKAPDFVALYQLLEPEPP